MAALVMSPSPGEHLLRFVGDRFQVTLTAPSEIAATCRAYLRTNLTRAAVARAEVVARSGRSAEDTLTFAGASWRDIPLTRRGDEFTLDLPLLEVGHFRAKAYLRDERGHQLWPDGGDLGISVHPDHLRTANIIYCVFPRTVGRTDTPLSASLGAAVSELDERGYSVIPPSGTLRALTRVLPHVFDTLGCRILHLLPIGPVPTTFARMGRYGSPYAQLDLTAIDPALTELDKRSTGVDQFRELADGVHLRSGLLFLDIVLNHTGWASRLMEEHARWFVRNADGTFHSPGAWGTTWEDLVELDQRQTELWDVLANALIVWCKRGVDGFRCDAGYMIPLPAWQYIVARVRAQFPNSVFLLEGLGGAWEATETLLSAGNMQWAYSELFQCFTPRHVAEYLDHANRQSRRLGLLAHYSETHDNDRLAKKGALWSTMRNQLSALSSHSGAFGFSAGVEWLCTQKFDVHEAHSLSWAQGPNLVDELARLNRLLQSHPCFFDGAEVERVSPVDAPVLVLARSSADAREHCLVLVNLDVEGPHDARIPVDTWQRGGEKLIDLLGNQAPAAERQDDVVVVSLTAGQSFCLAHARPINGAVGDTYRREHAQAAWAYEQLAHFLPHEQIGNADYAQLAQLVARDPHAFLGCLPELDAEHAATDLIAAIARAKARSSYRAVIRLAPDDARRITLLPPAHVLLLEDVLPFEARVGQGGDEQHLRSTQLGATHVVALAPRADAEERDLQVRIERFGQPGHAVHAVVRTLSSTPRVRRGGAEDLLLLTNGRGAMARFYANLGQVRSKYDCLLGANLHPDVPVDRHVLVKRVRAWVNADGFITPLDADNLASVDPGSPAQLSFQANAGDGRRVGICMSFELVEQRNALLIEVKRVPLAGNDLPAACTVSVTLRFDLEDRSFHGETRADAQLEQRFRDNTHAHDRGFLFAPDPARALRAVTTVGAYHPAEEWSRDIEHGVDLERNQAHLGDAYSPGWFELPLTDAPAILLLSADEEAPQVQSSVRPAEGKDPFEATLRAAVAQFIARRGPGRTVIAGYPWFLDWGRDTFVAARGLVAAGYHDEVLAMLLTYAALERNGTLPNHLAGAGEGSRETSDAPLWFALAAEELAAHKGKSLYEARAHDGRTLRDVLVSIASSLLNGAPNGVHIDHESALVYSPPHFTWMDTNYPACSPRQGYPIELAAMWIRLLEQLARIGVNELAQQPIVHWIELAKSSFELYWREEHGFFSDTLHAVAGAPARQARGDDHLRPNQLLAISLGIVSGERARRAVEAASRHLLVPGAMRTLAPLPVHEALPVRNDHGALLNDPTRPYWGRYEGDEDTRRKPAYHNGTAWPWWLATFCEALSLAYDRQPRARAAARAILGSSARSLSEGCLGHLPEILDGDAPHLQRGCDAQAWSVSEMLRGWLTI